MPLFKNKKNIWIFFIINIILIVIYAGLYYTIASKNKKTAEIFSSLYQQSSEKEKMNFLEKTLADTEEKRKTLDTYFINSSGAVDFIERVEKLSTVVGVPVKIDSVVPPKSTSEQFILTLSATGSFTQMYRLFGLLDKMPYLISVKKANLSELKTEEKNIEPKWNGSFTIALLSYLDK